MKRGRRLAQTRRGMLARRWMQALFIHGHRRILYPWVLSGQAARDFALLDLYEAMDDDEQEAREGGR